eukprot:1184957-Prorocentrum_minimum.AAC.3
MKLLRAHRARRASLGDGAHFNIPDRRPVWTQRPARGHPIGSPYLRVLVRSAGVGAVESLPRGLHSGPLEYIPRGLHRSKHLRLQQVLVVLQPANVV